MKIRSDFVTNSSSSSFTLIIDVKLKNGNHISFVGDGASDGERKNYFNGNAIVNVSPKELGTAKTIDEMIMLLTEGVVDDNYGDEVKIFEASNPYEGVDWDDVDWDEYDGSSDSLETKIFDAYDFINEIRNKIKSMDEIKSINITGDEENYYTYNRSYTYDLETKKYFGTQYGDEPEEREGEMGGDLIFSTQGCEIDYESCDNDDEYDEDEEY